MLDALTALNAKFCSPAQFLFVMTLVEDGWPELTARHFLAQATWEDRMCATWLSIGQEDRAAAVSLNYETFQNFWPNLDFTAEDFTDRAKCWSSEVLTRQAASGCDAVVYCWIRRCWPNSPLWRAPAGTAGVNRAMAWRPYLSPAGAHPHACALRLLTDLLRGDGGKKPIHRIARW